MYPIALQRVNFGRVPALLANRMRDQRRGVAFDTFYRERRVVAAIDATPIARKEKIDLCRPGSWVAARR
jgi:hypothetical protein